jgi:DNA-binding MarR family transcriptional regulator
LLLGLPSSITEPYVDRAKVQASRQYVNNADLKGEAMRNSPTISHQRARSEPEGAPMYDIIELFYFAYRDFVGDADRLLEVYGFGRAHHRVLHFVSRQPGLTIAALLDILRITKQSLNRVLKELIAESFIEARAGALDRRHRQLYATTEGEKLARELAQVQTRRFSNAMQRLGPQGKEQAAAFLLSMIDLAERERVLELIGAARTRPYSQGGQPLE